MRVQVCSAYPCRTTLSGRHRFSVNWPINAPQWSIGEAPFPIVPQGGILWQPHRGLGRLFTLRARHVARSVGGAMGGMHSMSRVEHN